MSPEKNSFWKTKGFYLSACCLLICLMAAGAVFLKKSGLGNEDTPNRMMAEIATQSPVDTGKTVGNSAANTGKNALAANADMAEKIKEKKKELAEKKAQKEKNKKALEKKKQAENSEQPKSTPENKESSVQKLTFNEESGIIWPLKGDVIMNFSMNNTVYFKTLEQYKCNPGIMISAKTGTQVKAVADGIVEKIEKDPERGNMLTMKIGNKFEIVYGQINSITAKEGDKVTEGTVIGNVAKPTKYFTEEGSNLYLEVRKDGEAIDPMILLN